MLIHTPINLMLLISSFVMTVTTKMNPISLKLIQAIFMVWLMLQVYLVRAEEVRCIERERQALLHFKAGLVDHNGILSSWGSAQDKSDCCQWKRVRCSNQTGHVQILDLHGDYQGGWGFGPDGGFSSGKIHKSLMELHQLEYLNLSWNHFQDSHIPEFFGSLSNLRYLDLERSFSGGKIPSQLGSLSHLQYLNLGGNQLEGSIPHELGELSKLQYLDLSFNSFEATIPSPLANLSSLQKLYLGYGGALKIDDGNHARGQWLSNLTSLTHLDLSGALNLNNSHNWLQMIAKLPKLKELRLSECSLSDHFIFSLGPSKLNFSTSLAVFDLSLNTLTSSIIFQWVSNVSSNLVELDLSGNLLEGSTSNDFGSKMIFLERLDLSANRVKWGIFQSFMNMCTFSSSRNLSTGCVRYSLQELDLSWNQLTGPLPDLSVFPSLRRLDLSVNRLSGKIHESSKLPSQLETLSIHSNSLEGGIPKSFGNMCTLGSLDMSENNLSEELPVIIHHLSGCARYSLQQLHLQRNEIKGTLPDISIFPALKTVDLSENRLNGKIPEESRWPSQLEYLSIGSNSLKGGIPKSFGNTCTLGSLDLSNNSLSEELPVIIHHLSGCARYSLQQLDLQTNEINGSLPDLSIFPSLKGLYLSENRLKGRIDADTRFPSQLEILQMSSNSLEGVITDHHFANLSGLKILDLSDNSLALKFSQNWVPSFQLNFTSLRSCQLGPAFPKWLRTQNSFITLDISNAGISDVVPEWFWPLLVSPKVDSVNISYNNLRGTIPNLPLRITALFISLASNQFEGPVPPFLGNAISLDLSKNKFSSSLLFLCANRTRETLGQLDLSNNQLSGQIPDCWSHFKSLAYLDLSNNNFSGKAPNSMGSLLELQALILRNNRLTGELAPSLRSCTNLVLLDAGENRLSGPIPSWIGTRLHQLQMLSLRMNTFFGSIPLPLCHLTSIQLLDLSQNDLSGRIPKCFKNFTAMTKERFSTDPNGHVYNVNLSDTSSATEAYDLHALLMWKGMERMFENNNLLLKSIDLSRNQLSEEIPIEMGDLVQLVSLNLSRNNLTGKIPSEVGRLTSLEFLDLSTNHLFGSIPSSLAHIDRLSMLDLSHNNLSGEIPSGTQLQSFNASCYEDNLDLCGRPLEKMCIEVESPQGPIVKLQEQEVSILTRSFYVSMAIGFVIGFWGIFGSIAVNRSWRHAYFRLLNNLTDSIYVMVAVKVAKFHKWHKG